MIFRSALILLALTVLPVALPKAALAGEEIPQGEQTFFGPNGASLALGFVYTYVPGTSTPKISWQDQGLTVANNNPIQLDANGQARLWGTPGDSYREVLLDMNGTLIFDQVVQLAGNVAGPSSTTVGHLATWNSTNGTLLGGDPSIAVNVNDLDLQPGSLTSLSSFNSLFLPSYTTQQTALRLKLGLNGSVSDIVGSFNDAAYFEASDADTSTAYINQHNVDALRAATFGPNTGGSFTTSGKQLNGITAYAYGASSGVSQPSYSPGVSGIQARGVQYGAGVGDNEFYAIQPSSADGSIDHASALVGVRSFINSNFSNNSSSNLAYAFQANNVGVKKITGYYGANLSGNGTADYFIDAGNATVQSAAIVMPGSGTDSAGTIINYGLNNGGTSSYTYWDHSINGGSYFWVNTGANIMRVDNAGLDLATVGSGIATTAVGPFIYFSGMAGTPTGTPTKWSLGSVPCTYDTTNHKFWCYDNGTWRGTVLN